MTKNPTLLKQTLHGFTLLLATLAHTPAWAEAIISFPSNTEVLVANGEANTATTLTLANGTQQILFKHIDSYRDFGDKKRFTSEAIVLTFTASDGRYEVELPNINSNRGADNFNRSPRLTITDEQSNEVKFKIDVLKKDGLQLGRNYVEEIHLYNGYAPEPKAPPKTAPAAVAAVPVTSAAATSSPSAAKAVTTPVSDTTAVNTDQINVGQMLDFWYSQADEQTRKAFKQRIENQ